jgi:hypothetical protein
METKFLVQLAFSYGWDDAGWSTTTDDDGTMVPELFDTREEAQTAIDELIGSIAEAVAEGDMSDEYHAEDYRIVEVDPATWRREK